MLANVALSDGQLAHITCQRQARADYRAAVSLSSLISTTGRAFLLIPFASHMSSRAHLCVTSTSSMA